MSKILYSPHQIREPISRATGLGSKFDVRLSPHFLLSEFLVSSRYPDLAKQVVVSRIEIERIRFACAAYFEPLRLRFGRVIITSGKRSPELNIAVGGHDHSHHMFLEDHGATDFVVPDADPKDVRHFLLRSTMFRYLIWYWEGKFHHLSYPDNSGIYNKFWEEP